MLVRIFRRPSLAVPRDIFIHRRNYSSRKAQILSMYRRALKLSLDWTVNRHQWRGQAMYLRSVFEANKNVTDPRQVQKLIDEGEYFLREWRHPEPYRPPGAPGGSKWERNLEAPILDVPPPMIL